MHPYDEILANYKPRPVPPELLIPWHQMTPLQRRGKQPIPTLKEQLQEKVRRIKNGEENI